MKKNFFCALATACAIFIAAQHESHALGQKRFNTVKSPSCDLTLVNGELNGYSIILFEQNDASFFASKGYYPEIISKNEHEQKIANGSYKKDSFILTVDSLNLFTSGRCRYEHVMLQSVKRANPYVSALVDEGTFNASDCIEVKSKITKQFPRCKIQ